MNGEVSIQAFEGIGAAPAAMQVALGGDPTLDVLSFAGLTVALIAAVLLLVLNREERPHTV